MGSPKSSGEPKRVAQWLYVRPEKLEEYKKCHAAVWPAVLEQIKDSNIIDCKEFFPRRFSRRVASLSIDCRLYLLRTVAERPFRNL